LLTVLQTLRPIPRDKRQRCGAADGAKARVTPHCGHLNRICLNLSIRYKALRQASRRSWRIGQRHPVRVKFLVHKGTTQTTCLRLMGKKMLVALMMEGKFSGEGLHSIESDDDLMSAMARELVERGNVGESAAAVWADLKREREQQMPSMPTLSQTELGEEGDPSLPLLPPKPVTASSPALHLIESNPKTQQKPSTLWPTGHTEGEQMLLFA
jgi:hypothetical protein